MRPIIKKIAVFLLFAVVVAAVAALCGCDYNGDNLSEAEQIYDSGNSTATDHNTSEVYTVTYADGNEVITCKKIAYNCLAENLKLDDTEDYEFLFWTADGVKYDFSIPVTKDLRLQACWQAIEHTATFICRQEVVKVCTFTADNKNIEEPDPIEEFGYTVEWPKYKLGSKDIEIEAAYALIEYTVEFFVDADKVGETQYCTIMNYNKIIAPDKPEREGFTVEWDYEIDGDYVKVVAKYTENTSTGETGGENNEPSENERPDEKEDIKLEGTEGLEYAKVSGGLEVTGYSGTETKIVIPSTHDGQAVVSVGVMAFLQSEITEVYVCDGVLKIDNNAFYICKSLEKVRLPQSLEILGSGAFEHSGIKSIDLPEKIEKLESNTFAHCENLESVTMHENLKEIGAQAFANCKNLKNIDLSNVLVIKLKAFLNCTALENVELNKDATVDKTAFYNE